MKTINQNIFIFLLGLVAASCVERYFPDTETNFQPKLVVQAIIAADDGLQEIVISKSTSVDETKLVTLSGCSVVVEDSGEHRFTFNEAGETGCYRGYLEGSAVVVGNKYRLRLKTPEGKEYVSRFEKLMPCPDVSFVYYEVQTQPTPDKKVNKNGLQFYIDYKGDDNYGRFYRWELTQTYEYHSTWPLDKWLDVDGPHDLIRPDYSNYTCYKTDKLDDIFVLSTDGFAQNRFTKYKLHFVPDQTQVLQYRYNLLVRQYSLTQSAFNYWENLKKNNQEAANLFGRQPANVKGNILNVNDTTEVVLGYFGVSVVKSKRVRVDPVPGLRFNKLNKCRAAKQDGPLPDARPIYFVEDYDVDGNSYMGIAGADCIFCQMFGGTTQKPTYWDEK